MLELSRVHCTSSSSSSSSSNVRGGNRRGSSAVGALVLCILLCAGTVLGTSSPPPPGDRYTVNAAAAMARERTAGAGRYADQAAAARNGRSTGNLSHISGTARKIKMFIKNRYLQVLPDGTVNSTAEDTNDYVILQRTSVNMGQLKIQGVATCMYLCMDACGLLYGSKDFEEECVFNEMIEQNHYNTYSSAKYTNERRTLYLALNKRGTPRKVQVKANASLGKLSTYTRVLTQPVSAQRVERLLATRPPVSGEWPASMPHGHRHHHACPPHAGPPLPTAKHRKFGGRKCQSNKGRKKTKEDTANKEDEDCGGGNKKSNRCGTDVDEINHRKVDAAGRKKKSKKPTVFGGKGDKPARQQGNVKKSDSADAVSPLLLSPPDPVVVVHTVTTVIAPSQFTEEEDNDDDEDSVSAVTASSGEFLDHNENQT